MLRKCIIVATFKSFYVKSVLIFALEPLVLSESFGSIFLDITGPSRTKPNRKYQNTEILVFLVWLGRTLDDMLEFRKFQFILLFNKRLIVEVTILILT